MDIISIFSIGLADLYSMASDTASYWAPLVFGYIFWIVWIRYVQTDFISKVKWVLLELHLPREIFKPPQVMEFVLATLDQGSVGSKIRQIWLGSVPLWFSLEMVSIEGIPRFFIRTPSFFRNLIESRLYSQYPNIEISEAPDYTEFVSYKTNGEISLIGSEFELVKADPYPIKTYIDYGLDKGFVDEKQRFDPVTPMIEFIGSLGPGEHVWVQILVRAHAKRLKKKDGTLGDWRDEARAEIKKMVEGESKPGKEGEKKDKPQLTRTQQDNIAAIERNMSKTGLDCGIRAIYLAKKDKFNPGHIPSLFNIFKQFNSAELNGFKPVRITSLDYPWDKLDDYLGSPRMNRVRKRLFDAYRRRSYFYPPFTRKPFVLTTEELATIFRPPSGIAETPTLRRIASKKAEPPLNLPL